MVERELLLVAAMKHQYPFLGCCVPLFPVIVIGQDIPAAYFARNRGAAGIQAAQRQYQAWLAVVTAAEWNTPMDVKASHAAASVLKGRRIVFNISANNYRLITVVSFNAGIIEIRWFGSHRDYDGVDAETI